MVEKKARFNHYIVYTFDLYNLPDNFATKNSVYDSFYFTLKDRRHSQGWETIKTNVFFFLYDHPLKIV